jgi:hypothetical protein
MPCINRHPHTLTRTPARAHNAPTPILLLVRSLTLSQTQMCLGRLCPGELHAFFFGSGRAARQPSSTCAHSSSDSRVP